MSRKTHRRQACARQEGRLGGRVRLYRAGADPRLFRSGGALRRHAGRAQGQPHGFGHRRPGGAGVDHPRHRHHQHLRHRQSIIMSPDPTTTLGMRVTSVQASSAGRRRRSPGATPAARMTERGQRTITIPANLIGGSQSIIKSDVHLHLQRAGGLSAAQRLHLQLHLLSAAADRRSDHPRQPLRPLSRRQVAVAAPEEQQPEKADREQDR